MKFFTFTKTLLKALFDKPATAAYPLGKKIYFDKTRGAVKIDIKACIFCGLCQRKCPTAAISVTKTPKTWEIDRMRCITCGACAEVCPKKCLILSNQYSSPTSGALKEIFQDA
ncbi:MAG: 4Fe-4S dicluster domain-containing protein [Candidatus Omnitrophica bacterium]|nr:4Fe-4S dicluster domain-containing protein [Candidatus Omnitrophota bacterium]